MARAKSPSAINHRKTMKAAKGFRQSRSSRLKVAKEAVMHAGQYAYIGRRLRRRDKRALWIMRMNAALRENDMSYSRFIDALKKANIVLNRKMLSNIAANDPQTFTKIVEKVK